MTSNDGRFVHAASSGATSRPAAIAMMPAADTVLMFMNPNPPEETQVR